MKPPGKVNANELHFATHVIFGRDLVMQGPSACHVIGIEADETSKGSNLEIQSKAVGYFNRQSNSLGQAVCREFVELERRPHYHVEPTLTILYHPELLLVLGPGNVRLKYANGQTASGLREVSKNGVLGDPRGATAEMGEAVLDSLVNWLEAQLRTPISHGPE